MRQQASARGRLGVLGLAAWLGITVTWWALALWPAASDTPAWLLRTRAVCFNTGPSGLPTASGWLLLIGQPIGMLAVMMVVWGESVRSAVRGLRSRTLGRAVLAGAVALLAGGGTATLVRVATVWTAGPPSLLDELPPPTYPRLDRVVPDFRLVDQFGAEVTEESLRDRPTLLTFAFGHCETVCPLVVHQAGEVVRTLIARDPERAPRVWVVTLDPWRDTPSRLPALAEQWMLPEGSLALSGDPDTVNALLDALEIPRQRDSVTGDLVHPALVFLVGSSGIIAYASTGGPQQLLALAERL